MILKRLKRTVSLNYIHNMFLFNLLSESWNPLISLIISISYNPFNDILLPFRAAGRERGSPEEGAGARRARVYCTFIFIVLYYSIFIIESIIYIYIYTYIVYLLYILGCIIYWDVYIVYSIIYTSQYILYIYSIYYIIILYIYIIVHYFYRSIL